MPVHRVPKTDADDRIREIGKTENVVSVEGDGSDAETLIVTTEDKPVSKRAGGDKETRS